jgi:hypothetical protein
MTVAVSEGEDNFIHSASFSIGCICAYVLVLKKRKKTIKRKIIKRAGTEFACSWCIE